MSQQNPYVGVDAHLNSWLQTPGIGMWQSFHAVFITFLTNSLTAELPDNYVAFEERSLQQRTLDAEGGVKISQRRPDVSIFQDTSTTPSARPVTQTATLTTPTIELPLAPMLETELQMRAIVIRRVDDDSSSIGTIVTRIEVLSPANKPGGSQHAAYQVKRYEAIETGVPLIEIDLLHEQHTPISEMPQYPDDAKSHPYTLALTDPRPRIDQGIIRIYGFSVGRKLPKFAVPLANDETLPFDFEAPYQQTVRARRWRRFVDYSKEPERFETYRADDQATIHAVMQQSKDKSNG